MAGRPGIMMQNPDIKERLSDDGHPRSFKTCTVFQVSPLIQTAMQVSVVVFWADLTEELGTEVFQLIVSQKCKTSG